MDIQTDILTPLKIETDNISLHFNYTNFNDYIQGFPAINYIDIKYNDFLQRRIKLSYQHYNSISKGNNLYSYEVKRPFLTKIQFQDRWFNLYNQFAFEYYNPDQIPHRLSFSQDLLGYYNGIDNSNFIFNSLEDYNNLPDFHYIKENEEEFNTFLHNYTGNRKPNADYAKHGLLKKITYPTKGYTEFEYEGNFTDIPVIIYPPYVEDNIHLEPEQFAPVNNSVEKFLTIPFSQRLYLIRHSVALQGSEDCSLTPDHWRASFTLFTGVTL